ncbi:hypothetical protein O181_133168 [Austropuccinia psidii MF-1]|uniref:Uncharacterized protein n=1 Tax=Austropuccinia psidii MF-1 TaxID=1389203 RepID=A0A9Q3L586_9BASI|nr:hypothetical protein [Austropuccinia psidii MF-1]
MSHWTSNTSRNDSLIYMGCPAAGQWRHLSFLTNTCLLRPKTKDWLSIPWASAIAVSLAVSTTSAQPLALTSLSQFLKWPSLLHCKAFLHILCYLQGTPNMGLVYSRHGSGGLVAYSDAYWGNCWKTH